MSSSFQDFAYCGTRELIFSIPSQKFFLLCRFFDRYVHIVGEGEGEGEGVKKVYMDGYLDNQLMLLGWLSHGMAMSVADANGPFIISEITNKLVFRWTIVSSSFQDFAYCGTCELIFSNPPRNGNTGGRCRWPFIIFEITNKLIFWWTIVSSSFQEFAYCGTRELIFSNPAQKLFLLFRFIDRYVQIVGERDGVKKVYMDGYLDNQLMFLGWLSHGMAMLVAYADAPFIISGMGMVSHGMAMPVADADGPFIISETTNKLVFGWTIVSSSFQDFAYCGTRELIFSNPDNRLMLLGWLSHGMAMPVADDNGPFIISEITNKLDFRWTIVSSSFQDFAYCGTRELIFSNPAQKFFLLCRFINRYIQIVGDRVKKVYMDGYLDNQCQWPFIISEITNKLVFRWTIVSSSFQDFAYNGTRELIFSNPAQKHFLLCRFIDRYVQIVGEGDGVKKVYMDGYLYNQLMLLGWLSPGMAMPVADADGRLLFLKLQTISFLGGLL
ncbi:hypothetical protein CASFOL_022486 [Castilleja foliolosa]|uniref:Uncharacterized protein n=1 Tax=Castilleja foliolosa TaxID=1961234 RepID=A0ABD3CXC7_9LAMI